ncbi:DUF2784 domain-containing protein [Aquisalimonas asiatica]|uniref:DUF2784 domain-containing protein n=1 Tax=Aquisalimonas asiatica TaxID=406100 RepID=A0A1H8RR21_9GAMM|nr:DUF2784 domain-containing protein [Aquisalimonas asiatica]SEO68921.1 Protein of Unknown function [Aquisalimonas asiatica]
MERTGYRFAADAIKWFHAVFVLFALLGAPVALLGTGWMVLHLAVLAWAAGINFGGCTCPLTPLENRFRAAAGESGYAGGFIQHYLERSGLQGMPRRQLEVRVAWVLLAWNAALYLALFALG